MNIIYRLCGIASTNPSPIYQENKYKLNELCLKSLVGAFSEVKPHVTFLFDHCGIEYNNLLDNFPLDFDVEWSSAGINQTMIRSYELASEMNDYVYFGECDHLWLPDSGNTFLEAIKDLKLVSGYDHPDFYTRPDIHPPETEVRLVNNHHFKKSYRNVMSWGCHSDLVKENLDMLKTYGYLDNEVWVKLREKGYWLWTALPALSTHMVRDFMAPSNNWEAVWSSIQLS